MSGLKKGKSDLSAMQFQEARVTIKANKDVLALKCEFWPAIFLSIWLKEANEIDKSQ